MSTHIARLVFRNLFWKEKWQNAHISDARWQVHCSKVLCILSVATFVYYVILPSDMLLVFQGVIKPDIVFFGEMLPSRFHLYESDLPQAGLLIIMGTSLEVGGDVLTLQ